MATSKSQGSSSNGRDSNGQRLGVKRYGNQFVNAGEIILKQRGTKILPGTNVSKATDDSLFARKAGIVTFEWAKKDKQKVSVYSKEELAAKAAKTAPKAKAEAAPKAEKAEPKAKKAAAAKPAKKAEAK
ncbi:large subunit ribosomal protein L27 [Elusimicrobium posterum]